MAYLRRLPQSRYWIAGFTLPDGRRTQRSTRQTERRAAWRVARQWEADALRQAVQARAQAPTAPPRSPARAAARPPSSPADPLPPPAPPRLTQADLARQAGVHPSTVSLALKGHPSISLRTRDRVHRLAAKLGYAPDPLLAALAVYRRRRRPATYHGTLAWLTNSAFAYDWRGVPQFIDYHAGAAARALHHGYQLEGYDLNTAGMSPARLAAILHARGVAGILLCPQPRPSTHLNFPWADFSAVTFGYSLAWPHLHTVTSTQYRDTLLALREVQALGYRRIGLLLKRDHDERTDHNYLAGYLAAMHLAGGAPPAPPLDTAYDQPQGVRAWVRRHRLDAIVAAGGATALIGLERTGLRIPQEVGLASPNLAAPDDRLAGVVENSREIGAVAVDLLVAMIQRGERGLPAFPQRLHVEGRWHPGPSLQAVRARR